MPLMPIMIVQMRCEGCYANERYVYFEVYFGTSIIYLHLIEAIFGSFRMYFNLSETIFGTFRMYLNLSEAIFSLPC